MKKLITLTPLIIIVLFLSCEDFLNPGDNHDEDVNDASIDNSSDTIYFVTGILTKLEAIADRTILLGELRGDLVDINSNASSDLRDVALFNIGDDNVYNSPVDYYAIINNCNFFLSKVDTTLKNDNNEYIFMKEYSVVKAWRAWTYLQLVLNYGRVPFVVDPILTEEESLRDYEYKDIRGVCEYFIDDLAPYASINTPDYGTIGSVNSKMFFFPIYILLGDLNLWAENYEEAAKNYYRYLSNRNGSYSTTPITTSRVYWQNTSWVQSSVFDGWSSFFSSDAEEPGGELVVMLPGEENSTSYGYSQLRDLFNSTENNDYLASIIPSQALTNISAKQKYCYLPSLNGTPIYPSSGLDGFLDGDLRLSATISTNGIGVPSDRMDDYQKIIKYSTQHVHLYRIGLVYLRLAEALNRAGYPHFAFKILQKGINNEVIEDEIKPYYAEWPSWLDEFNLSATSYITTSYLSSTSSSEANTIGLHSRGSGWTTSNEYYTMPENEDLTGQDLLSWQIEKVEDMIIDEEALEFAFEGYRFYDLMRISLRRNDPSYLADRVNARRGEGVASGISKDLNDISNWYLSWKGEIGMY